MQLDFRYRTSGDLLKVLRLSTVLMDTMKKPLTFNRLKINIIVESITSMLMEKTRRKFLIYNEL